MEMGLVFEFYLLGWPVGTPNYTQIPRSVLLPVGLRMERKLRPAESNTKMSADSVTQETVKFYSDRPDVVAGVPVERVVAGGLPYSVREDRTHGLLDFLKRPVLLDEFDWSISSAANSLIGTYANPTALLSNAMVAQKVAGFVGFKAKMVLRVQVNAQRFQQGRLLIHYLPTPGLISGSRNTVVNSNLVFKSQQPHTDFDVSTDTDVALAMPFVYPYEFYLLSSTFTQAIVGSYYITVYSPLVSPAGSTTAGVTVWGYFEDVELAYPTLLVPQIFEAQAGRRSNGGAGSTPMSNSESELMAVGAGPISGLLAKVSASANILSEIPLLSSVTAPVSWVSAILSRAASAMGFSNPSSSSPANRMLAIRTPYSNNANGIDNSMKFGLLADNAVEALPGFSGTDVDELSIRHAVGIPSWIKTVSWSLTDTIGSVVWSTPMSPYAMINDITVPTALSTIDVWLPSPVAYFSNLFTYWRGSFCVTLKVVKTEFHSGRLIVAWVPGAVTNPTLANISPLYKEILDLRNSNEFSVCIPFVSVAPWRLFYSSTGRLVVYVLNELKAPATVSSSVSILVEVSGGPDFEVCVPNNQARIPVSGAYAAQMWDGIYDAQVLGADSADQSNCASMSKPGVISSSSMYDGGLAAAKYCIGESVLSLRQLLKRSVPWYSVATTSASNLRFRTFSMEYAVFTSGSDPVWTPGQMTDYWAYLGSVFMFSRGGIRVKMWDATQAAVNVGARLLYDTAGYTAVSSFAAATYDSPAMSNVVYANTSMSGALEIEVPQYTTTHMRVNRPSAAGSTFFGDEYFGSTLVEVNFSNVASSLFRVYRQASDDVEMGFFFGCMPLIAQSLGGTLQGSGVW